MLVVCVLQRVLRPLCSGTLAFKDLCPAASAASDPGFQVNDLSPTAPTGPATRPGYGTTRANMTAFVRREL